MDAERLLEFGERGIHLLFDTSTISEAFSQDRSLLRDFAAERTTEISFAVDHLTRLPTARAARSFIQELPRETQYVLVLLYFELLDGRLRKNRVLH